MDVAVCVSENFCFNSFLTFYF